MIATQRRPRPLFCATRHLHRSREVADAACEGRFTNAGITVELGVEPDWLGAGLPPDEEWRISWTKFYFGLDLASAFEETGDRRYLEAWERLVRSWIDQVPAGSDATDVAARRIQNWIHAWDLFASSPDFPGLEDRLDERIAASVAEQARFVRDHLTPARNHRTLELHALFVCGLAFEDDALRDLAVDGLHRNLLADFRPDGVHVEASTHYHLIALRSFLSARENARRYGIRFPSEFDERLARACEFALHCHRPDGGIPALSDADGGSYRELLELAASLLGLPELVNPGRRHAGFPDGGYWTQRSGWDPDARFLIFDCGPLGEGGHGHYDLLSVEIAAGGRPLVMDPGRCTYVPGAERHWFKGTQAHNTVCVDGLDQTPYAPGKPRHGAAEGRFLCRLAARGLEVLWGEARSPCYDAVHARRVVFVAEEYWILEDLLRAETPHEYDLRFHLAPEAWRATSLTYDGTCAVVRAPGLALVVDPGSDVRIEPGWVSPEYGVRRPAPVVSARIERAVDATFHTLVVPLSGDAAAPRLSVRSDNGRTLVEIDGVAAGGRTRDLVSWPHAGRPTVTWTREGPGGVVLRAAATAAEDDR